MFNYKEKVKELTKYAEAYYNNDKPLVSDYTYDILYHQVLDYEREHQEEVLPTSPTQRIIGKVKSGFNKITHPNRMWSQQDIFTEEELFKWVTKVLAYNPSTICSECKFDGLSLKLIYENGILKTASTRGDGVIGEDVTINAKMIKSIPLRIPLNKIIEINGEIVMHKDDFIKLNKDRLINGLSEFANERNAAAGSLRLLDKSEFLKRKLVFYKWEIVGAFDNITSNEVYILNELFNGNPITHHSNYRDYENLTLNDRDILFKGLISQYTDFLNRRDDLDMVIDGVIFKVCDENPRILEDIGYTNKYPKWSCAFKFPPVDETTYINNVIYQVGRTGVITPVAVLQPVIVDGSLVSRVTLNNVSYILTNDVRINDRISLIKSGDVIPKILKIHKEDRVNSNKLILPTNCPSCNSILEFDDVNLYCKNINCRDRVKNAIIFYCSREQMNLTDIGPSVIEDLLNNDLISNVLDLYKLKYEDLIKLDGYQDTKVNNILTSIENSKRSELYKFIAALGISGFGRTISKMVCDIYSYNIFIISLEELLSIKGVGKTIANNFIDYMVKNKSYVMELFSKVKPKDKGSIKGRYTKMDIVLTGSMEPNKNTIKEALEKQGATIKSSVSKTTDLVVYGENAGSKLTKAKKLNIDTLHYKEITK